MPLARVQPIYLSPAPSEKTKPMRPALLLLVFLLIHLSLSAQLAGGSAYSSFGVGDLNLLGRGQNQGIANLGVAWRPEGGLNLRNPAANTSILSPVNVILETGFNFSVNQRKTNSENIVQRDGGLSDFVFWLRPYKKWGIALGLQPFSKVQYSTLTDQRATGDPNAYQTINTGSGGLSNLFWSNGYQLTKQLSLGFSANLLFGNIEDEASVFVRSNNTSFEALTSTQIQGFHFDYGLQLTLPVGANELTLGATLRTAQDLRSVRDVSLFTTRDTLIENGSTTDDRYGIPLTYGLGASYQTNRWTIMGEFNFEGWSSVASDTEEELVDVYSAGIALIGTPFRNQYQTRYESVRLKAGFTYRNSQLRINGTSFDQWVASAGVGIPYRRGRNQLDISYSFHRRGTLDNELILESQHQIGVSFSLRDVWFQKRLFGK